MQGLAALANKKLPPDAAKVALRTLDASGRQIPALSEALTKAGGLTSGPRELSADEMKALVAEVAEKGNAHRGEAIYRRKELNCLKCHTIGGAGGRVGPDMLSLGSSAQIDYIAESLLAPNKKVKENFNSLVVVTDDGKVRSGIKLRQTDTDLLLRDAEDSVGRGRRDNRRCRYLRSATSSDLLGLAKLLAWSDGKSR